MNLSSLSKPDERVGSNTNPFDSDAAVRHSSYSAFSSDEKLVRVSGGTVTAAEELVHDSFRELVLNPKFSCVAAKSAIRSGSYRFGHYPKLGNTPCVEGLARDLFSFVGEQDDFDGFNTFVATFQSPASMSEKEFEARLWSTLQALNDLGSRKHDWDPSVTADPNDAHFGFSFGGRAFFVVGLHSGASRLTRRFALRSEGRYNRIQDVIRARAVRLGPRSQSCVTPVANEVSLVEAWPHLSREAALPQRP